MITGMIGNSLRDFRSTSAPPAPGRRMSVMTRENSPCSRAASAASPSATASTLYPSPFSASASEMRRIFSSSTMRMLLLMLPPE